MDIVKMSILLKMTGKFNTAIKITARFLEDEYKSILKFIQQAKKLE